MNRSLYTKLVLIILFLIIALTAVTGVFLTRGVRSYYLNEFYARMQEVFGGRGAGLGPALRRRGGRPGQHGRGARRLHGPPGHRHRHEKLPHPLRRHGPLARGQHHAGKRRGPHAEHHLRHIRRQRLRQRPDGGLHGRRPAHRGRLHGLYRLCNRQPRHDAEPKQPAPAHNRGGHGRRPHHLGVPQPAAGQDHDSAHPRT